MASHAQQFESVVDGLKRIYKTRIRPVEEQFRYDHFSSPLLDDGDFDAKPMVLLLGQYSVGKTSFVRYLLEGDFPGIRIGPEPTTDRFVAVMQGEDERSTPGNAAAVQADLPFRGLGRFGTGFLNKFEVAHSNSRLLRSITLIDTPGVLSGEKQRIGRSYEFTEVVEWFAERSDIILLLFDAHKLDISDEFKRAIEALKGQDDKIRVVLNKADMVSNQQLMRVYGALMWSLGKVVKTPEVTRVYIGSFWDRPYQREDTAKLFDAERADLLRDLKTLPRNAAIRKANELVKRARMVKVHAHLINHLRSKMPSLWGKEKKQKELLDNLLDHFREVQKATQLPPSDFPNLHRFKERCSSMELHKFPKLNPKHIAAMDEVLSRQVPHLLEQLGAEIAAGLGPQEAMRDSEYREAASKAGAASAQPSGPPPGADPEFYHRLRAFYARYNPDKLESIPTIMQAYKGREKALFDNLIAQYGPEPTASVEAPPSGANPFENPSSSNPFASPTVEWAIGDEEAAKYREAFQSAGPVNGVLSGGAARGVLMESGLGVQQLGKIWELGDIDRDGALDEEEFAVTMYLVELAKRGEELPSRLPEDLIPPSRRGASSGNNSSGAATTPSPKDAGAML